MLRPRFDIRYSQPKVQLMNLIDRYFFAATITVTIVLWLYLGLLVAGS